MDKSGDDGRGHVGPTGMREALRAAPLFTLVGCWDWCSWEVHVPGHQHVTDGVAELVVSDDDPHGFPCVYEVRHHGAPRAPQNGSQRAAGASSAIVLPLYGALVDDDR